MYRILTINGGGIRGYLSLLVLTYIEQQSGKKISDMFDLVVGTSSGAIAAALLDTLPASYIASTLRESYKKKLFKPNWFSFGGLVKTKYNTQEKYNLIDQIIGDKAFKNFEFGCVAYDIKSNRPVIFNTLEQENNYKYLITNRYSIADAVKASSAAPLYWDPHCLDEMILIDGALVGNDPTNAAIKLALDNNKKLEDLYIVNLTTGINTRSYNFRSGANPLKWAVPFIDMLMNSQANATSMTYTNEGLNYYSLDVPLQYSSDSIDNVSTKNLDRLELDAENLISNHKKTIDEIIKDLTK